MGNKLTNLVLTANKLKLESERESITRLERSGSTFFETIENCLPCAISWHWKFLIIDIDSKSLLSSIPGMPTFPFFSFMSSYTLDSVCKDVCGVP